MREDLKPRKLYPRPESTTNLRDGLGSRRGPGAGGGAGVPLDAAARKGEPHA